MNGRVIVITSGKGGVGKTTATASIGAALALMGKKTAVVDMDIGLRNLDVVMGLENRIVFNIVDAVKHKCKPSQVAIKDRRIELVTVAKTPVKNTKRTPVRKKPQYPPPSEHILLRDPAHHDRARSPVLAKIAYPRTQPRHRNLPKNINLARQ